MDSLPWYWKIKRCDSGPNYHLELKFDISDAEFQPWVEQWLRSDYTLVSQHASVWRHQDSRPSSYLNVTLYPNATVGIELGWGIERPDADALIQQLLCSSKPLVEWRISAGGEGYGWKNFGDGLDMASLVNYCCGDPPAV